MPGRRARGEAPLFLAAVLVLGTVEGALDVRDAGGEAVFARAPELLGYAAVTWLLPALVALALGALLAAAWRAVRGGRAAGAAGGARRVRAVPLGAALFVALVLLADGSFGRVAWWGALLAGLAGAWLWARAAPALLARLPRALPWATLALAAALPPALGLAWHPGAPRGAPPRADRPNLVLVVADALRADALSCYGGATPTPQLDALAAAGWRVPDVLAASSWTLPSVATLLTGSSPRVHGVRDVDGVLPADLATLTGQLRAAGYATGAVLGNPILDGRRGFTRHVRHLRGEPHRAEASFFWIVRLNRWAVRLGLLRGPHAGSKLVIPILDGQGLRARRTGVLMADELVDAGLELLDGFAGGPFFLYLHAFDPHDPYLPHPAGVLADEPRFTPENADRLRALYAGEVAFLDAQLGRLLRELERRGLARDTLVAFTADHGEEFLDHGRFLHRASLHDELVRLPLLLRFPAGVEPGPAPERASLADLAPTLLGALGLPPLPDAQGRDLRAAPPAPLRATERIQDGAWLAALRTAGEHWIFELPRAPAGPSPTLEELLGDGPDPLGRLRLRVYDLAADPGQTRDLADARRAELPAMLAALRAYFAAGRDASRAPLDPESLATLRSLGYVK